VVGAAGLRRGRARGGAIGTPIGILMGASPRINAALSPLVDPFRSAPIVAVVPVLVMWFGIGETDQDRIFVHGRGGLSHSDGAGCHDGGATGVLDQRAGLGCDAVGGGAARGDSDGDASHGRCHHRLGVDHVDVYYGR
jgi:hypothetical protein